MMHASLRNEGQGLVEYALIISFVVLVVIVLLFIFGPAVGNMYSNVIQNI
jgi:pilus assembly protein Flp/PilA